MVIGYHRSIALILIFMVELEKDVIVRIFTERYLTVHFITCKVYETAIGIVTLERCRYITCEQVIL